MSYIFRKIFIFYLHFGSNHTYVVLLLRHCQDINIYNIINVRSNYREIKRENRGNINLLIALKSNEFNHLALMLSKELDARKFISTWYSSWCALLNVFWFVISYLVHLVPFYPLISKGLRKLVKHFRQMQVPARRRIIDGASWGTTK